MTKDTKLNVWEYLLGEIKKTRTLSKMMTHLGSLPRDVYDCPARYKISYVFQHDATALTKLQT